MELLERAGEIAALHDAFGAVQRSGTGSVVVVSGDPGIGKSALVASFVAGLGPGVGLLRGGCDDLFVARPLGPLLDIARRMGGRLRDVCDRGEPAAMFDAFVDELTGAAAPTVVVIEDLQWADMATLDLVRVVARRLGELAVLVILTHRDDVGRDHPLRRTLGGLAGARLARVRLGPLSVASVRHLAGDRSVDPELLHALTGGNPFYVVEALSAGGDLLPDSVREAVLARAARLSDDARRMLDAASVIGLQVDRGVLAGVVGDATAVDELVDARFLVPDAGGWAFEHDVVRRSVERAVPPELRRQLHARALSVLGDSGDLARRAHHAIGADDREALRTVGPQAARMASRLGAHREAAALYAEVLRVVDGPGRPTSERCALLDACASAQVRADQPLAAVATLEELVSATELGGDPLALAAVLATLSRAYREAGDGARSLEAAERADEVVAGSGDATAVASSRSRRRTRMFSVGDLEGIIAAGDEQLAADPGSGADDAWAVPLLNTVGSARLLSGDDRGWAQLVTSLARAEGRGWGADIARAHCNLASVAVETYQLAAADRFFARGLDVARSHDLGLYRCMRGTRTTLLLRTGRWAAARDEALALLRDADLSRMQRLEPLVTLALVRARLGDPDPGELLGEAAALVGPAGELDLSHLVDAASAEVAWLGGDASALERAARAMRLAAGASSYVWLRGEAALWGRRAGIETGPLDGLPAPYLDQLSGRPAEAAVAWASLGAAYESADALADSDDPDELRRAYDQLHVLGARPRLATVTRSLRRHGIGGLPRGPRATTAANRAGLTEREHEVLALLGEGLTNADIAVRLVVSPKTVGHHVSAVLHKLGAVNRREAVRRAIEIGLVART